MKVTDLLSEEQRKVLAQARSTYGITKQILVSAEELCELAAVCTKFPRYQTTDKAQTELHNSAVDEVSDVLIVLDHIVNIFGLSSDEISARIQGKVDRLSRWMSVSDSMEYTTEDRAVTAKPVLCQSCTYEMHWKEKTGPCHRCGESHKNYQKALPCDGCKHKWNFDNLRPGGRCIKCKETSGSLFESVGGNFK